MNPFLSLKPEEYMALETRVLEALTKSILPLRRNEDEIVYNLVRHISEHINNFQFSNGIIKARGVFVHKTPQVTCDRFRRTSIEIGDMLLIASYIENGKLLNRRALLLQAKKYKWPPCPDNDDQLYLYRYWPKFKYIHRRLKEEYRHAIDLDMYDGAQFLFLPKKHSCFEPFYSYPLAPSCLRLHTGIRVLTAKPTEPLSHYRHFYHQITQLLIGNAGKKFSLNNISDNDIGWNKIIEDLIEGTKRGAQYTKPYDGKAAFGARSEDFFYGTKSEEGMLINPSNNESLSETAKLSNNKEEPESISTIEFKINQDEIKE